MAEPWFDLSANDQREALEVAAAETGLPAYILEKDIWVVWTLQTLGSDQLLLSTLTFKGGTSLSKAHGLIDRFSEDVDLTLDIRHLLPSAGMPPAPSRKQAKQRKEDVNAQLPHWVASTPLPLLQKAAADAGLSVRVIIKENKASALEVRYEPIVQRPAARAPYVSPTVLLEFGAHSTGEPHGHMEIICEAARALNDIAFPSAEPLVMDARRTFWEKATAIHVFCRRGQWGKGDGARYARHWFDIDRLASAGVASAAIQDRALAMAVAQQKQDFWRSRDSENKEIDYLKAINGDLQLVPTDAAKTVLESDYRAMTESGMLRGEVPIFNELMERIARLEEQCNGIARSLT
ncbi:MAG: nucleotidyl transferase AbiEii/AbiGii toxin family protein [Prochlorococcaceae cyanobacterium]